LLLFRFQDDVYNCIGASRTLGLRGAILWGSAKDVNNKEKCLRLQSYMEQTLGPVVHHVKTAPVTEIEKRLTGRKRRANLPDNFWATYFLEPITKILRRQSIRNN
jgi:Hyaluronidase